MAEVLRIEIPIEVSDRTEPEISRAQRRVSEFERTAQRTQERLRQMNRTRWQLTLSAFDRATPVIERVGGTLRNITGRTWRISLSVATAPLRALDWVWRRLTSIQSLVAAFLASQAFRHGILGPLALESRLQRARIGFETFLGSAQRAQQFIAELQRFAAETPFEMVELLDWSVQLLPVFRGNTEMVLRTLRAFGDAAAMTGAGVEGMSLALLGFRQIATMGRLQMEELRQVTENLLVPLEPILEELGIAKEDLKDLGKKGIPAARAMEAILRALERPVERGGFLGGMARQMATLENQVTRLRDHLTMSFVQPWGQGLASGVAAALGRVSDWFERNRTTVERWSQKIEQAGRLLGDWFAQRVERFFARLQSLMADPVAMAEPQVLNRAALRAWEESRREYVRDLARAVSPAGDIPALNRAIRRAMEAGPRMPKPQPRQLSLGEWMRLAWDRLIVEPFEQWWGSGGQEKVRQIAERVGRIFGGGVNTALAAALGVTGGTESPFVQAGATAGKAFFDGFLSAIDGGKIADKVAQAAGQAVAKAGTIFPGGAPATAGSWLSAGLLAWLASRLLFRGRGGGRGGGAMPGGGGGGRGFEWIRGRLGRRSPEPPVPTGSLRLPPGWEVLQRERPDRPPLRVPRGWEILTQRPPLGGPTRLPWWQRARDWIWRRIFPRGRGGRRYPAMRGFWGVGFTAAPGRSFPGAMGVALDAAAIIGARPGAERTQVVGSILGRTIGGAIGAGLGSLVPGPGTAIGGIIGSWLGGMAGERVAQPIANFFRRIVPGHVREGMTAAQQEAAAGVGQVASAIGTLPGQANSILGAFPGLVGTWLGPLPGVMGGAASDAVGAATGAFGGLPGGVSPHLAAVIARINAIGPSWFAAARHAASQLASGVMSAITSLPGRVGGILDRIMSRVRSAGSSLFQTARNAFGRFVGGYRAGMDEHSPGYIERSMYRIMEVSRATAFAVGSDMQRLAASMGPRMRALHDGIMATGSPAPRVEPVAQARSVAVRPVSITVQPAQVNITVQVDGGNPERVVQAIEANVKRIAKALADPVAVEIVRAVLQVQANSPRAALA
ncbi:MAG: tape measure protein [Symbiobacteriaceae bacterium]